MWQRCCVVSCLFKKHYNCGEGCVDEYRTRLFYDQHWYLDSKLYSMRKGGGVTRWRSWLRLCAISWKVSGSIPCIVTGIFHWHNLSGFTMDLESTQPLIEMSTRNISWWLKWPVRRADDLTTFMCRFSWNPGASISGNWQGCNGISLPLQSSLFWNDTDNLRRLHACLLTAATTCFCFMYVSWCH